MKIKLTDHYYDPFEFPDTIYIKTKHFSATFTFFPFQYWYWEWMIEAKKDYLIIEFPSMSVRVIKPSTRA